MKRLSTLVVAVAVATSWAYAAVGSADAATAKTPTTYAGMPDEQALLALANLGRADPQFFGKPVSGEGNERPMPPLVWNGALGAAAHDHVEDEIVHNCNQHDSCNGELWWKRVQSYYGNYVVGENVASKAVPWSLNSSWMHSDEHRAELLNPTWYDFGGGYGVQPTGALLSFGTEDFGAKNLGNPYPTIPAGALLTHDITAVPGIEWQLLVNYYDANGHKPTSVDAVIDGVHQSLSLLAGTSTNGTWSAYRPLGVTNLGQLTGCKAVHYEITRDDGQKFRWPTNKDLGMGNVGCFGTWVNSTEEPPPPTDASVVIDAPSSGTHVTRNVQIRAHATGAARLEVWVDQKRLVSTHASKVTRGWNAGQKSVAPGQHTIRVDAFDANNKLVASASVNVNK